MKLIPHTWLSFPLPLEAQLLVLTSSRRSVHALGLSSTLGPITTSEVASHHPDEAEAQICELGWVCLKALTGQGQGGNDDGDAGMVNR